MSDGIKTTCLGDSIEALLRKCVPANNTTELSAEKRALRQRVEGYINMDLEPIISVKEINMVMCKFKNKKSPGRNNFKIENVKEIWRKMPEASTQRIFPKLWKEASLNILLNDENRDRTLLNSYRTIALLSVVGKTYEKVIVNRIQETYKEVRLESPDQFEFKKGKKTDDAFISLRRAI